MDDATWRALFRIVTLCALLAIMFGVPLLCALAYRIHRSQGHLLNNLLLWARDTKQPVPEPPPEPPPDVMGMDLGIGLLLARLFGR